MVKLIKRIKQEILDEIHHEFKKEHQRARLRETMHKEVKKEVHTGLAIAILLIALMLAVGTIFFHYSEGWSYVDAFYFSGSTITTVGYGDLVPTSDVTKVAVIFYAIFTLGLVFYAASLIASRIMQKIKIPIFSKNSRTK